MPIVNARRLGSPAPGQERRKEGFLVGGGWAGWGRGGGWVGIGGGGFCGFFVVRSGPSTTSVCSSSSDMGGGVSGSPPQILCEGLGWGLGEGGPIRVCLLQTRHKANSDPIRKLDPV